MTAVQFQVGNVGWKTDDILVTGVTPFQETSRQAIQVKLDFVFQKSNPDSAKVIRDAFDDSRNSALFDPAHDRVVLIAGTLASDFRKGIRGLIDLSRASDKSADFYRRVSTPRHVSNRTRGYLTTISEILNDDDRQAEEDEIWRFLRVFDFAILDFSDAPGTTKTLTVALLAGTCNGPAGQAGDTWTRLLDIVAQGAANGSEVRYEALPNVLKERHKAASSDDREIVSAVRESSDVIRRRTKTTIGGVQVQRSEAQSDVLEALENFDIAVVTGEGGTGKSAVAAGVYDLYETDSLAVVFRAESLGESHLSVAATKQGFSFRSMLRLFALHDRNLLWIESAERLLEKSEAEREAFGDLMHQIAGLGGKWKILITCRRYSVDTLVSAFLSGSGLGHAVVDVPNFSSEEVAQIAAAVPRLEVPLAVPFLVKLLKNPFYLSMAAGMNWSPNVPPPLNERAFRLKAWSEMVCKTSEQRDGIHLERDRAMVEICLRRARTLASYVSGENLSSYALKALVAGGLLSQDPDNLTGFTPEHDVFEDWALMIWVQREFDRSRALNQSFYSALGTYPAMRRAYRRWFAERLEFEADLAARDVISILRDEALGAAWKDETLLAILHSTQVETLLQLLDDELRADNCALLLRAVLLLRVSGKVPVGDASAGGLPKLRASGDAWKILAVLVFEAVLTMPQQFWPQLLEFAKEAAPLAADEPRGDAARAVALIGRCNYALSEKIDRSARRFFGERSLNVMLEVPLPVEGWVREAVDGRLSESRARDESGILDAIWNHFTGEQVARLLPDITLKVAKARLQVGEERPRDPRRRSIPLREIENFFGLEPGIRMEHYPASAYQGPFLNLLNYHPEEGLRFILDLINEAVAFYAVASAEEGEPPVQVIVKLGDGNEIRQWSSPLLWEMYRGFDNAPHVLESALMALETWLLQKVKNEDDDALDVYSRLLVESNNVAVTAVLASVAGAAPMRVGARALPLFTCPDFFGMDLVRAVKEGSGLHRNFGGFENNPRRMAYIAERKVAAEIPHRREHLEHLAVRLQMSEPVAAKIFEILDGHYAGLPPRKRQSPEHIRSRFSLNRIDTRKYVTYTAPGGQEILMSGIPDKDLQKFVEKTAGARSEQEARVGLYMWGVSCLEGSSAENYRGEDWRQRLAAAQTHVPTETDKSWGVAMPSGVPQVATVCIRDRWDEMTPDEREWCVNTVCSEIETLDAGGLFHSTASGLLDGKQGSAFVFPLALSKSHLSPVMRDRLTRCMVIAALSPSPEVTVSVCRGIGEYLYVIDRALVDGCLQAMLNLADGEHQFHTRQRTLDFDAREDEEAFGARLRSQLVDEVLSGLSLKEEQILNGNYGRFPVAGLFIPFLAAFFPNCSESLGARFFEKVASAVGTSWMQPRFPQTLDYDDDDDPLDATDVHRDGLHEAHKVLARVLLLAPLEQANPLVDNLVEKSIRSPENASSFISNLIIAEDSLRTGARFWHIWQRFADFAAEAYTEINLDQNESAGSYLRTLLLSDVAGTELHGDWSPLEGETHRPTALFSALPASYVSLSAFVVLMTRVSKQFSTAAYEPVADKLSPEVVMSDQATKGLEVALTRLIGSGSATIRRDSAVHDSIMKVLDYMIAKGSSHAFRLRDDFITPLRD